MALGVGHIWSERESPLILDRCSPKQAEVVDTEDLAAAAPVVPGLSNPTSKIQGLRRGSAGAMTGDVIPDSRSGGTHTSRTIMLRDLAALFAAVGKRGSRADYQRAILDDNVLSKRSESTRRRSLRYLRELYILDPASALFRGLAELWVADTQARPLLALVTALSRDPLLRATAPAVLGLSHGDSVISSDLAEAIGRQYPDSYSDAVLAKIGRNTASSWTQSGHLDGRSVKVRVSPNARPSSLAFALFVGHLAGAAGAGLFETIYAHALDRPKYALYEDAFAAAQRGWIDFRQAGEVIDVSFRWFMREPDNGSDI